MRDEIGDRTPRPGPHLGPDRPTAQHHRRRRGTPLPESDHDQLDQDPRQNAEFRSSQ
jgi:hypothetical protein